MKQVAAKLARFLISLTYENHVMFIKQSFNNCYGNIVKEKTKEADIWSRLTHVLWFCK